MPQILRKISKFSRHCKKCLNLPTIFININISLSKLYAYLCDTYHSTNQNIMRKTLYTLLIFLGAILVYGNYGVVLNMQH